MATEPVHPLAPNRNRDVPLGPANASGLKVYEGRIADLQFTPSFGGILIPVVNGRQSFEGSKAPALPGGSAGDPMGAPHCWDIQCQPQNNDNNNFIAVYWQVRYWVEGAAYTTPIRMLDLGSVGARNLVFYNASNGQKVIASAVEVTMWAVTSQGPGLISNLKVSVAISPCEGGWSPSERFALQWAQGLIPALGGSFVVDKSGNQFLQGGAIAQYQAIMKTVGTVPLYPMLLDSTAALVSGTTTPIEGSVLPALNAAGQAAAYGDEFRPGMVNFNQSLQAALSTTPDVFTAPLSGTAKFQVKVCQ